MGASRLLKIFKDGVSRLEWWSDQNDQDRLHPIFIANRVITETKLNHFDRSVDR